MTFSERYNNNPVVSLVYSCSITDRIPGNTILVGDDNDWQKQVSCANVTSTRSVQTLPCSPKTPVRYLTIRHSTQRALGFCEVIVSGYLYEGKLSDLRCLSQNTFLNNITD